MFKINDLLATHSLESQWGSGITDNEIVQPDKDGKIDGFKVFDVRDRMLDARNPPEVYQRLTEEAIQIMKENGRVVICCSAGVSRSNAIAISVLIQHFGMTLPQAIALTRERVPIANPLSCHIEQIERLHYTSY